MPAYKDESGKWYCQFYYTDWTGKRRHTSKHGFARKKDAEDFEQKFKSKARKEVVSMEALLEAYDGHLADLVELGSIKLQTADNYRDNINRYIRPYFADVKNVSAITPARINKWLAGLVYSKVYKGKKLRSGTLRNIKARMNQIMEYAQQNYGLDSNPVEKAQDIKSDGRKNKRAEMWTLEQYQIFRETLPHYPMKVFFDLLFFAGLRISEAAVLTPKDIQPYKLIIKATYIRKSRSTTSDRKDTPKSQASVREVQIPHFLYFELTDYISRLYKLKPNENLFPFTPQNARDVMKYRVEKYDLPYASPHTLRHSYASLLLKVTKDAAVVSHQIGHANPRVTLATYSHMVPGEDRVAVDKLEEEVAPFSLVEIPTKVVP